MGFYLIQYLFLGKNFQRKKLIYICLWVYVCSFERKWAMYLIYDETAVIFVYGAVIQITAFTEKIPCHISGCNNS